MKTDAQVQQDVIDELKWEASVNSAGIGVEVKDGVVTLSGHVESYAEKHDAERAAQRVSGVMGLAVDIDVRLPGPSRRNDADIARSVENILQWTTYLPKDSVKVMVEDGCVTLSGEVNLEYQRRAAANAIQYAMGVTEVSNQISVKPLVSSKAVKSDIEAALKRRNRNDARSISVEVDGAEVTLTGTVRSWSERDLAQQSAWGTAGVRDVVDKITVVYSPDN